MYSRFVEYVEKEQLFAGCKRLLLAVSGGVDSVVLLHLVCRYAREHGPFDLAVAHCNFHLRGEESERDERFVRRLAGQHGLPLFLAGFQTGEHARRHKISIEMAARELRYGFFRKLLSDPGFDACLLAHHANDNAETFFINLFRGSGLRGLKGMLPKSGTNGRFVRPLLFALRSEISEYAVSCHLEFVQDSTNDQPMCVRNRVRHGLLPVVGAYCPDFVSRLNQSMHSLRLVDDLVKDWYENAWHRVVERQGMDGSGGEFIASGKLPALDPHQELFWELYLREKAFSRKQIAQVSVNRQAGTAGRKFHNADGTGFLTRESDGWRWVPDVQVPSAELAPVSEQEKVILHQRAELDPDPDVAYLNFGKLRFPLHWRHWRPGDRFCPLGMKGSRKLSDFFKDLHLGTARKEKAWLLCSGEDIVWVAGYRLDDRYKIDFSKPGEKTAWKITLKGNADR